jgi:hypothetical protein
MPNSLTSVKQKSRERNRWQRTYDDVICLQFKRPRLCAFWTESFTIDECAIGRFGIFDVNLRHKKKANELLSCRDMTRLRAHLVGFFPDLSVMTTEHLRVEKAVMFPRRSFCVRLPTDLDALSRWKVDMS